MSHRPIFLACTESETLCYPRCWRAVMSETLKPWYASPPPHGDIREEHLSRVDRARLSLPFAPHRCALHPLAQSP